MDKRQFRLGLEILEGREAPSTLTTSPTTITPVVVHPTTTIVSTSTTIVRQTHALAGSGRGTYVCTLEYGTMPSGYHMFGTGTVQGMGAVQMQIDVYGVGFHTVGTAHGTITFTNARGSVTVQLTGPMQPRLSPLPQWFKYTVTKATGAYSSLRDSGTLRLVRTPSAVPVVNGLRFFEAGSFRVII